MSGQLQVTTAKEHGRAACIELIYSSIVTQRLWGSLDYILSCVKWTGLDLKYKERT